MDFDDRWTISSSFQLVIGKFWSDFWLWPADILDINQTFENILDIIFKVLTKYEKSIIFFTKKKLIKNIWTKNFVETNAA